MLSRRGQAGLEAEILSLASDSASKNVLGLENLSSACPRTFYFGLVKMSVMMELVITVSLQWLSTKVIYLLTLCYWYKLVQVHVHGSI